MLNFFVNIEKYSRLFLPQFSGIFLTAKNSNRKERKIIEPITERKTGNRLFTVQGR